MKLSLIILCTLLSMGTIHSQDVSPVIKSWTSYSYAIDLSELQSQEFRVSVAAKADNTGRNFRGGLWVRIDRKDEKPGFYKNNAYSVPVTADWQIYEINGVVDEGTNQMYIGAFCENNGNFYFDDFKAEFKDKTGVWKSVNIKNSGFESASLDDTWYEGVHKTLQEKAKYFTIDLSEKNPHSGEKSLLIQGKDIIGDNPSGLFKEVNGVKLYYEIYGKGEPLLMIHGNGQSLNAFINQVEIFSKNYKVILVDSRGRGNSSYDEDVKLTYTLQAMDMKLFLNSIGIEKAHILGWSDGGIIGLIMAINHPEKVKSLVAMGANIFPEGLLDARLKSHKETILAIEEKGESGLYLDLYKLLANYPQLEFDDLKEIQSKTLIMAGDHDVIKNIHTINMFEAIPDAQLAILPNETHYLPQENPELFNELVLDFLKEK